jgi:hypothetical protein
VSVPKVTWDKFANLYCERMESTPEELALTMEKHIIAFEPDGWMLLECQMLDGSRLGERTILPFGPQNTYKTVPSGPISPRGLASDMSTVVAVCMRNQAQETGK